MSSTTHCKQGIEISEPVSSTMHSAHQSFAPQYDGNGRIHRYLIHEVMKHREPEHQFIIPISAAILKNQRKYDKVLETVSIPIMAMLDYEIDDENRIVVNNDIDYMYRYPDYTEHVKFVYDMMDAAVSDDLLREICLLTVFDRLKKFVNSSIDVPNKQIDTALSILIQNGGQASKRKRAAIEKLFGAEVLSQIENLATRLISDIKKKFEVDVVAMMNEKS